MWPQKWYASASPGATSEPTRLRARDAHHRRADAGQEAAPRARRRDGVGDPRRLRSRAHRAAAALGGRQHRLELGAGVERALGEHGAVGVERDRERAAGHVGGGPRVGVARPRRTCAGRRSGARRSACDRGRERAAQPAALGGEDGEADPARRSQVAPNASASALRAPTSGPSWATSSAPRGATESRSIPTSRASASTTTASATSPSSANASPIASQPSVVGSSRGSSGSERERGRQRRRAARRGAARPSPSRRSTRTARRRGRCRIAPTCTASRRPSAARRPSRPRADPAPTPTPSTSSTTISAAHTAARRRAASRMPYVASAARADAPPASFDPAAATSTSPRTRQTTTETIDGREGNSIRGRPDAGSAPSRPQETLRSRPRGRSSSSAAGTARRSWDACRRGP